MDPTEETSVRSLDASDGARAYEAWEHIVQGGEESNANAHSDCGGSDAEGGSNMTPGIWAAARGRSKDTSQPQDRQSVQPAIMRETL